MTFEAFQLVDGHLIAWMLGGVATVAAGLIAMYYRQQRLVREVYGSTDNDARPGLVKQQKETQECITQQIEGLEEHVDRQFDGLERTMIARHEEMALTIAKIVENMEDPPDDVDVYGPWYGTGVSRNRKRDRDRDRVNWARDYRNDEADD